MNQTFTLEEAFVRILQENWHIAGGRLGSGKATFANIGFVREEGDSFIFVDENNLETTLPRRELHAEYADFNGRPHVIYFMGPITTMRQRKKADGGGMEEAEQIGCILKVVNSEVHARYEEAIAEQQRHTNEVARARETELRSLAAERAHHEDEKRHSRIKTFLAEQNGRIAGLRIVGLEGNPEGLVIKFENGFKLSVKLDNSDSEEGQLIVDVDGYTINLSDGYTPVSY